jgi:hypothetical protein
MMARQMQTVEINKFSGGLITDASPLTTPENCSLDEDNMVLNIDGSRNRRLGLDYEVGHVGIGSNVGPANTQDVSVSTFRWDNAGGDPGMSILVTQFGNDLRFSRLDGSPISSALIGGFSFLGVTPGTKFAFATVDGMLVVVNGDKEVYVFELTGPTTIISSQRRLKVRDLFGIEDYWLDGVDTTRGTGVLVRPAELEPAHVYNLRNQSWGVPRLDGNNETSKDPIEAFYDTTTGFPSNSDTVVESLYADATDTDNRTVERFFPLNLYHNPMGTSRAAQGYFIIDALDRGSSRFEEYQFNMGRYPDLEYQMMQEYQDETPGGATAIAEFAGRVFYGGFPGTVVGGDSHSPRMSSYILFSKVVANISDINVCYQEGDPTSKYNADIIDTDGGFIRINEAYGIRKLVNLGSSLLVIATNGIWRVTGGDENGFTATSYIVEKISDRGCASPESIVQIDNTMMFWGDDGIYHVTTDQFGAWVCNNISYGRIQRFYNMISAESKAWSVGAYDPYERKVRWLYNNKTTNTGLTKELVFDVVLNAYYTNTIFRNFSSQYPKVVSLYTGLPYTNDSGQGPSASTQELNSTQREVGYLVLMNTGPNSSGLAFATYRDKEFRDFKSHDGVGADAHAYVVTCYFAGEDYQRDKQVSYVTTHMRRTETGYNSDMSTINGSSCLMQSRWGWSQNDNSGKWSRDIQCYRYRQLTLPTGPSDEPGNNFGVISTKSKIRGNGSVLSLRFMTEPYKDFHLFGWSMVISIKEEV